MTQSQSIKQFYARASMLSISGGEELESPSNRALPGLQPPQGSVPVCQQTVAPHVPVTPSCYFPSKPKIKPSPLRGGKHQRGSVKLQRLQSKQSRDVQTEKRHPSEVEARSTEPCGQMFSQDISSSSGAPINMWLP